MAHYLSRRLSNAVQSACMRVIDGGVLFVAEITDSTVIDIDEFVRIGRTKWLQPTDQWVAPPEPR